MRTDGKRRGGVDLRVALGKLVLPNPVLVAAGTFGYGLEFRRHVRLDQLGGLVTKTLTRAPRQGNPQPRVVETPAGMLNSVGLHNIGLEAFLREKLPTLASVKVPVIVSLLGESREEVAAMSARLETEPAVAAIELNLSCPNLKKNGEWGMGNGDLNKDQSAIRIPQSTFPLMVAQDAEATFAMVEAARQRTSKPLIAKLSPDVTDPRPIAQAAERAGADALSLVNTFLGMSLDPHTRRSRLGSLTGGLSGPAIRPLAVFRVWKVRQAVRCPLIGIGGILNADDAVEFFLAGATAVAVGTANFADPAAAVKVLQGLRRYLERHQLDSIQRLVGTLQTDEQPQATAA
jgi:dihydroorotate dehydrogenase (NAD+) catalytic subunit